MKLREQFDNVLKREGKFDYVPWSSIADRLDEAEEVVLVGGWSFAILTIGPDWVHGRLTIGEQTFENIGYAENAEADWSKEVLKHAATDAFKRCAALAGVARYLYDKEAGHNGVARQTTKPTPIRQPARSSTAMPDMPEFPDDFGEPVRLTTDPLPPLPGRPYQDTLQPKPLEQCPIHPGEVWRGNLGDLYHKMPDGSGYCRPEGQPKKAKAR